MLGVKSKRDPGFSHLHFIKTLAKGEQVKLLFVKVPLGLKRFTVCDSTYMSEINMGPGSNAPVLKCQVSHLNSDQPFDRLFFPPWRNDKLFCTTLLFAKAHKRFLTVPSDTEDQPPVFTLIYKVTTLQVHYRTQVKYNPFYCNFLSQF